MKLYEAKNIITEVFENPFDKDKFSYFIRNLLKNLHPAEFRRSGYNIPKAFEDFIASYERLGKYEDEEGNLLDVLIVKLKRNHSIDYARSTQRNFVRWYLNDKGKDAALVAFTTEKSSEWRFSFIKMQYSLETKEDELTPSKRSSFLVGESGNSHTAQCQLIDLLKNDHTPYLSNIEDAFSIEAVSDEFYEKYKALLFNLVDEIENVVKRDKTVKDEFESKEISILNFSKKLLGQIVFLYFLQKKGLLGLEEKEKYGEGDKNFLRSLFNKTKKGENFFNDLINKLDKQINNKLKENKMVLDADLLSTIPGVDKEAATYILSEIGNNMDQFPNEQHLAAWAGLSPGNNESAGKKKSSRITHGDKWLKSMIVQCAWAATRTKGTYLRSKYDSLVGRRGKKRALVAVGHKILIAAYFILKNKESYKELGGQFLETRNREKQIKRHLKKLRDLGVDVSNYAA